jgi:hypothetical protein
VQLAIPMQAKEENCLGDGRNENTNPAILTKSTRARKPPQRYMHD